MERKKQETVNRSKKLYTVYAHHNYVQPEHMVKLVRIPWSLLPQFNNVHLNVILLH